MFFLSFAQYSAELVNTNKSRPTALAERMANLRQRRQERRTTLVDQQQQLTLIYSDRNLFLAFNDFAFFFYRDFSFSRLKIINWEPTEEFVKNSHVVNSAMQTMHIMGDLGPAGRSKTHVQWLKQSFCVIED